MYTARSSKQIFAIYKLDTIINMNSLKYTYEISFTLNIFLLYMYSYNKRKIDIEIFA